MAIWMFPKILGTLKSSILIGFSIINHPFWGTTIFGNTHIVGLEEVGTSEKNETKLYKYKQLEA